MAIQPPLSKWALDKIEAEKHEYIDRLIKLSQMVEDGKLSEGAARKVYLELLKAHNHNIASIKMIDAKWDSEIWPKVSFPLSQ